MLDVTSYRKFTTIMICQLQMAVIYIMAETFLVSALKYVNNILF